MRRKAQGKSFGRIVFVRPPTDGTIGNPSYAVLSFQPHVHHRVVAMARQHTFADVDVLVHQFVQIRFGFVHIDFVNHIRRQIFKRDACIASEKILAVHQ
ncbi:unknown [Prevotella sp. CAG:891]|nr:unknown [Prevotella sp. CAG:891]